jgi:hypothetical protein
LASVLCVHGIGQQHKGEETLRGEWAAALRDGIRLLALPQRTCRGIGTSGARSTGICSGRQGVYQAQAIRG